MSRTDEECHYKCGVCRTDQTFDRKFLVKRHLLEQHSGFAYICAGCNMIFPRRDNHTSCSGRYGSSRRMEIMRRSDGVSGREAERDYEEYIRGMERLIVTVNRRGDSRRRSRELSIHARGRVSPTSSPAHKRFRKDRTPSPVKEKTRSPSPRRKPSPSPRRRPSPSPSVCSAKSDSSEGSSSSSSSEAPATTKVQAKDVRVFELLPGLTLTLDIAKLKESI